MSTGDRARPRSIVPNRGRDSAPGVEHIANEMPADRITEREGHWYLRHAILTDGSHVFVCSNKAPKGTRATDLRPVKLEVLPSDDWMDSDPLVLGVETLRALMLWPPHEHSYGPWQDDPAGVVRICAGCGDIEARPEG